MKTEVDVRFRTFLKQVIWPSIRGGIGGFFLELFFWITFPLWIFDWPLNLLNVQNPGNNPITFPFLLPFWVMAILRCGYRIWRMEKEDDC